MQRFCFLSLKIYHNMAHYIGLLGKSLFSHIKWTCPHRYISHTSGFGKCERRIRKIISLVHFPCGRVLDNSYTESPHPTGESLSFLSINISSCPFNKVLISEGMSCDPIFYFFIVKLISPTFHMIFYYLVYLLRK